METISDEDDRFFSVELKSKVNLKNVTLTSEGQENVLVEGSIGKLVRAEFNENIVLEVIGEKGRLTINVSPFEIRKYKLQEP